MSAAIFPMILITLLFSLVPFALVIVLQVYLAKLEEDWPGLILPILSGISSSLLSLILLLGMIRSAALILLFLVILINIPAVVFILIYRTYHKKKASKEIDKMTIQDLG